MIGFLPHTRGFLGNNSRPSQTTEINFRINRNVLPASSCRCFNESHTLYNTCSGLKTSPWKLQPSPFVLFSGLFASNYMETHYLEDGAMVTGSHNLTVCLLFSFL